jgi:hypothetical protein
VTLCEQELGKRAADPAHSAGGTCHEDRVAVFMFRRHVADCAPQTIALIEAIAALLLQYQMLADDRYGSLPAKLILSITGLLYPRKADIQSDVHLRRFVP